MLLNLNFYGSSGTQYTNSQENRQDSIIHGFGIIFGIVSIYSIAFAIKVITSQHTKNRRHCAAIYGILFF